MFLLYMLQVSVADTKACFSKNKTKMMRKGNVTVLCIILQNNAILSL